MPRSAVPAPCLSTCSGPMDRQAVQTPCFPLAMNRILILEDEEIWRETLADFLQAHDWTVATAANGAEFRKLYRPGAFHLAIIDLGLPDGDGTELIQYIRAGDPNLGVVVLTGRNTDQSRVVGLNLGADQFVSKPVRLDVQLAVVESLQRRLQGSTERAVWRLCASPRTLRFRDQVPIMLSHQDFEILRAIMQGAGKVVSRRDLVTALGQDYVTYDQRRIDSQIRRLRRKVSENWGMVLPINTVHGVGYLFGAEGMVLD